ncbi:ACT domain-containing protein [Alteromonas sp. KS69]|uniref:ACT domain-containing protein n=1 Tax=unclassified Alteromonas TaxID=2614992 RepID=UPI0021B00C22|nr:ACT domain-containing protein [Alteromonas sp. KS69]
MTCNVHSSLDAVGMTAVMSAALTQANISANVVAGYYHDHIFVPAGRADEAIAVLFELANPS